MRPLEPFQTLPGIELALVVHNQYWRTAHGRVEKTSTDSEKYPDIDGKRESKTEADVEQLSWVRCLGDSSASDPFRLGVRYLSAGESEEEKQEGASKLASHSDKMISGFVGQPSQVGNSTILRLL